MFKMFRRHPEIKGFIKIANYPGSIKPLGYFEKYTSGELLNYPKVWKPVYYKDALGNKKLEDLGL